MTTPPDSTGANAAPHGSAAEPPAIECRGVTFVYPRAADEPVDPLPALDGLTLDVPVGTRLGILGPNGGGKSTFLKLALGLLTPQRGTIRVFGLAPAEASRRGLVGYVPQRVEAELAFPITVRQAVAMSTWRGLSPWSRPSAKAAQAVESALSLVGIADLADRPVGRLSGGQLQRAMIARALAGTPRLLLLDEPTVGIDVAGQQRFAALMNTLHAALGLTIVVVTHDLRAIAAASDRVACLSRTLHSHVAPEGLTPAVLAEVFQHDVAAIFGDLHIDAHAASQCDDPSHRHHHRHPASGATP